MEGRKERHPGGRVVIYGKRKKMRTEARIWKELKINLDVNRERIR